MAKQTTAERRAKGLYWDRVFKINEGCTKCSPGCDNCWSERETLMRACNPNKKVGSRARAVIDPGIPDEFSGKILLRHDNLDLPLHVKKPAVFAVWNDLFHIDVPCDFINQVYDIMVQSPQHTFLVLTKRSSAMARYINFAITEDSNQTPVWIQRCTDEEGEFYFPDNIYHGVTVCNQAEADEKIPHLLQVPGKRFLSIEPMLGPIDFSSVKFPLNLDGYPMMSLAIKGTLLGIHQVLLGGESGKNARPMHPSWVRSIRDQCQAASVPFMFKQWGEWYGGPMYQPSKGIMRICRDNKIEPFDHEEYPRAFTMFGADGSVKRIGKKKAGRTLNGQLHDELIWDKEE